MNHIDNDLESFQRWGMMVVDEPREDLHAVEALEKGLDASNEFRAGVGSEDAIDSDRSAGGLVNDLVKEIVTFEKNQKPDTPSWWRPTDPIIAALAIWMHPLADYIEGPNLERFISKSVEHRSLVYEKVLPAIKHVSEITDALSEAGYLS